MKLPARWPPSQPHWTDCFHSSPARKALQGALWWPLRQDKMKQLQLTFGDLKSWARFKLFPENYNFYVFFFFKVTRGEIVLRKP